MDTFANQIAHAITNVAIAVLVPLLVMLAVKALKKLGISLDAEKQAQLEYVAKQAALKVEEVAANRIAAGLSKMSPTAKLRDAIGTVIDKLPNVSAKEAEDAIHAALPQIGAGASAGITVLGKAMQTREAGQ
jgi:hypothetical protein